MLKTHSFLLSGKSRSWIAGGIYCVLAVALTFSSGEVQAEEKTTLVVYAQSKPKATVTVGDAQKETVNDTQLLIEEKEERIQSEESVAAMQLEIANDIALKEKSKREKKEEKEAQLIRLSKEDKEVLLRIVEAEATGEDIKGKMLVANVVLNRVNCDRFPDTVKKVVFAKRQFSPIRDGRYYKVSISEDTKTAVERVLKGEDYSKGALYFMSRKQANPKNVKWFDTKLTMVVKHGTHEFFK